MATINKSDMSSDRRGNQGKGDLSRPGTVKGVRKNKALWGESSCCKTGILRIGGNCKRVVCEKCGQAL